MVDLANLKKEFRMTATEIECPVKGCKSVVKRRTRDIAVRSKDFLCNSCGIYIYPTTFEYMEESSNLLWNNKEDQNLLIAIKPFKAEADRLGRERSEDAVSWNVFRYFDRSGQLGPLLTHLAKSGKNCKVIYWSYSASDKAPWQPLLEARTEFGEAISLEKAKGKGVSEPDIILLTDDLIIFIEAKFGSPNKTSEKPDKLKRIIENPKCYLSGGNKWYQSVFKNDFATVVQDRKYELLRFWLFGSWLAKKDQKKFILANLVRETEESDIENEFGKHIKQTEDRRFFRWTWESLGSLLDGRGDQDSIRVRRYLSQKTNGFAEDKKNQVARPKKAFSLT